MALEDLSGTSGKERPRLIEHAQINNETDPWDSNTPEIPSHIETKDHAEINIARLRSKHSYLVQFLLSNPRLLELIQQVTYENTQERHNEQIFSGAYSPTWLKPDTKKVFYDIETFQLSGDAELRTLYPTGSTNYFEKQRIGACVSISDEGDVKLWDEALAKDLKEYLLSFEEIVSFNGLRFDNYILQGYSNSPQEHQAIINKSVDLLLLLEMIEGKRRKLDYYTSKYLRKGKLSRGSQARQVPKTLREGTPEEIAWVWKYCYWDTLLLKDLYQAVPVDATRKAQLFSRLVEIMDEEVRRSVVKVIGTRMLECSSRSAFTSENIDSPQEKALQAFTQAIQNEIEKSPEDVLECMTDDLKTADYGYGRDHESRFREHITNIIQQWSLSMVNVGDMPALGNLTEVIMRSINANPRLQKAHKNISKLKFFNPKYVVRTTLHQMDCAVVKEGSAIVINSNNENYLLIDQLQKNLLGKITSKVSGDIKKVYAFSITSSAAAEVNQDQVTLIKDNSMINDGIISTSPGGTVGAFEEKIRELLTTHFQQIMLDYRQKRVEGRLKDVGARVKSIDGIVIPTIEAEKPEWLRDIISEKRRLIAEIKHLESPEGETPCDASTPAPLPPGIG